MVKYYNFSNEKGLLERCQIRRTEIVFRRVNLNFIGTDCLYSVLFICLQYHSHCVVSECFPAVH